MEKFNVQRNEKEFYQKWNRKFEQYIEESKMKIIVEASEDIYEALSQVSIEEVIDTKKIYKENYNGEFSVFYKLKGLKFVVEDDGNQINEIFFEYIYNHNYRNHDYLLLDNDAQKLLQEIFYKFENVEMTKEKHDITSNKQRVSI